MGTWRPIRAVLLVGGLAGCFVKPGPPGASGALDGGPDANPTDAAPCTPGPWGAPIELSSLNTAGFDDYAPALSADKQTIVFHSRRNGEDVMFQATWNPSASAFGAPTPIAVPDFGGGPYLFGDGLTLWYHSYANGPADIVQVTRLGLADDFDALSQDSVAPFAVIDMHERDIEMSADGLDAVLFTNALDDAEISIASRTSTSAPFLSYSKIPSLVDTNYDCCPTISSDGLTVMWEGHTGPSGIWTASRPSRGEPFGAPTLFTAIDNTSSENGDPHLSADGRTLLYARNVNGDFDLVMLERTCQP